MTSPFTLQRRRLQGGTSGTKDASSAVSINTSGTKAASSAVSIKTRGTKAASSAVSIIKWYKGCFKCCKYNHKWHKGCFKLVYILCSRIKDALNAAKYSIDDTEESARLYFFTCIQVCSKEP